MNLSPEARRGARADLRVEPLEDRRLLSCTIFHDGSSLFIRGDRFQSDVIKVADDGAGNITVSCSGMSDMTFHGINVIGIRGGRRGDVLSYDLTGPLSGVRLVNVRGGRGSEVFNAMIGGKLQSGADLQINEQGGRGDDVVNFTDTGDLSSGSSLQFNSHGGRSADTTNVLLAGNVSSGSFLGLDLGGGRGVDSLHVSALGGVHIGAGALVDMLLRGGRGDDQESVDYAGTVEGTLDVAARSGPGNDQAAVNLKPTAGSDGLILANVNGGRGDDNLRLAIPVASSTSKPTVLATLNGGPGFDTCSSTDNVTVLNCEHMVPLSA
jgi:hypothetical protein